MRLADLRTLTNFDIDDPLMNTIGGVTLVLFGRLPRVGEKVFYADYEITVKEVSGMRITKVRVSRGPYARTNRRIRRKSRWRWKASPSPCSKIRPMARRRTRNRQSIDEYDNDLLNEPDLSRA
jgi:hypothetical protein